MIRLRTWIPVALVGITVALAVPSHAQLLNYLGGTRLNSTTQDADDEFYTRTLTTPVRFYGVSQSSLNVSNNGYIYVGDLTGNDYSNTTLPQAAASSFNATNPLIAPLWDDYYTYAGSGKILESVGTGYYAISWVSVQPLTSPKPAPTGASQTFQAIFFSSATTLGGFNFQADDIVFSYGKVAANFVDGGATSGNDGFGATVGVDRGGGTAATPNTVAAIFPGSTNGQLSSANKGLLPIYQSSKQAVLFRYDSAAGNYNVSIITTPVPAPGALTAFLLGTIPAVGWLRRSRLTRRASPDAVTETE